MSQISDSEIGVGYAKTYTKEASEAILPGIYYARLDAGAVIGEGPTRILLPVVGIACCSAPRTRDCHLSRQGSILTFSWSNWDSRRRLVSVRVDVSDSGGRQGHIFGMRAPL